MDVIHSSVVALMLFLTSSELVTGEVYYIKSSQNVSCSVAADQPCLTFSQFAVSTSNHQNITLIILPGSHSLLSSFHLRNLSSFSMLSELCAGTITCERSTSVYLQSISQVHIENLNFIGCGDSEFHSVGQALIQNTKFDGQASKRSALN